MSATSCTNRVHALNRGKHSERAILMMSAGGKPPMLLYWPLPVLNILGFSKCLRARLVNPVWRQANFGLPEESAYPSFATQQF